MVTDIARKCTLTAYNFACAQQNCERVLKMQSPACDLLFDTKKAPYRRIIEILSLQSSATPTDLKILYLWCHKPWKPCKKAPKLSRALYIHFCSLQISFRCVTLFLPLFGVHMHVTVWELQDPSRILVVIVLLRAAWQRHAPPNDFIL